MWSRSRTVPTRAPAAACARRGPGPRRRRSSCALTLRGFDLVGGDIGIRFGADQHATVEDLDVHNQIDQGITCNRTGESCDSITIRRVEIANTGNTMTGNGVSLGCSDMSCTASNSVVEGCYIHDLAGSGGAGVAV